VAINSRKKPFDDVRVRRAIMHAIDRKAFIDGVQEGLGRPIGSHFAPTGAGYVDLTSMYPYDPEKAKALLKEAGVPKDVAAGLVQQVLGREVAALKEFHTKSDQEYTALQQELGDKFADFEESGRRAFRASGLEKGVLDKIELAIGTKAMLNMFGKFGQAMTEASAPQPGKQGGSSQFTQTADQAKQRIDTLSRDSDFQAKLLSPNPEVRKAANAEWEGLFKTAYPS